MSTEHYYVEWCRTMFGNLNDGGTWGVPRSGLIFQRSGDCLRLIARMPWQEGMEISAKELRVQQDWDFNETRRQFRQAGIPVFDLEEE